MNKKRYLALDQALQTTGWAIFEEKELIDYGSFTIPAHESIDKRLFLFLNKLSKINKDYNFEFSKVFFEDIQYQQNAETFKKLAYVQAVILKYCYYNGCSFEILSPSHWRRILKDKYDYSFGRSRKEQKEKAISFVKDNYNIEVSSDIADAICIGIAGIIEENKNKSAF